MLLGSNDEKFSGVGGFACSAKLSKDLDRCSFFIPLAKTLCRLGGGSFIVGCWYVLEYFCVCGNQKNLKKVFLDRVWLDI